MKPEHLRNTLSALLTFVATAAVACSTSLQAPAVDAGPIVEASTEDTAAPPIEDADVDAGYCYNKGAQVDAASAIIVASCDDARVRRNNGPESPVDIMCIDFAQISVSFPEAVEKMDCTRRTDGGLMGAWAKGKPCDHAKLSGGCRYIIRISNLCETVITYWFKSGGEAGTTEAEARALCSAKGNGTFIVP